MSEKKRNHSVLLVILLIAVLLFAAVYTILTTREINKYTNEYNELVSELNRLSVENEELKQIIEDPDRAKEEAAIKNGYGYQDESRVYKP